MGTDGGDVVQLEIPARPEYLALVRLLVSASASGVPMFPDDRIDDLRLAVSEVCTNAIEAHVRATRDRRPSSPGDPAGADDRPEQLDHADQIVIRCRLSDDAVEVEVRDHGLGFDPASLSDHPPVTDPRRLDYERGLGIPLVRILTDEVEFHPTADGTSVRMVLNAVPPTLANDGD